ncbi:MAG: amidohydrolase, partial [Pseudomonadota bacterium]
APIPIFFYAGIGPQTRPLPFKVPYKAYIGPSIGELYFQDDQQIEEVLKQYAGESISFHCEDPAILQSFKNGATHEARRPPQAEISSVQKAISWSEKYHFQAKLCHLSSHESWALAKQAKEKNVAITTEVSPFHLYFSAENIGTPSNWWQINPPIRKPEDAEAALEALAKGEIDYLATDHAPHSAQEKDQGTSGMPGLDIYAGFVTWLWEEKMISPAILAKVCAENPGNFISRYIPSLEAHSTQYQGLGQGFGHIAKGFSATFTVLNLHTPWTVTLADIKGKLKWSPFLGKTFPGKKAALFVRGQRFE